MATIATPVRGDRRVVFHDVPWETYVGLLNARREGLVRLTYHRRVLEVMTTGGGVSSKESAAGYQRSSAHAER
jgi:hypothetical protein